MPPVLAIEWKSKAVRLLDQTLLPARVKYLTIRTENEMWEAIRALRVRGAPAIGVAAAYGLYLGVARTRPATLPAVRKATAKVAAYLATARPTAVNLFWALKEATAVIDALPATTTAKDALAVLLDRARVIEADDRQRCDAMARHGAPLLDGVAGVVTHCNTGGLATAGCGTALGVILAGLQRKPFTVFADETRPLLQGARLTAFELQQAGADYRLITDSMAATVLARGLAQAVLVGADRIAANGDAANKIGTMPLAIVARHFAVPFYVVAPLSTFDEKLTDGTGIPIEERDEREVTAFGGVATAPKGARAFNPAFDVTPARLITAIVTEVGVLRAPYRSSIRAALASASRGGR